ncbi:Uncharacterised protein [Chlamydia trachomatis]|nr:Uncharacterised protein [Chlamydia trachomatis]
MMFNIVGDARTEVRPSRRSPNQTKSKIVYEILVLKIIHQKLFGNHKLYHPRTVTGGLRYALAAPTKQTGFATLFATTAIHNTPQKRDGDKNSVPKIYYL